jgi:hypothetical protein
VTDHPLVPADIDGTVYLVMNDFRPFGYAYVETGELESDRETIITKLIKGEYDRPIRVTAFNLAEGWARDVSAEIAREIVARAGHDLPPGIRRFVGSHVQPILGISIED